MIQFARYEKTQLVESFRKQLQARVESGHLTQDELQQLVATYEAGAARGTYLE
jgi:arginine decarboxylase-like protein